MDGALLSLQAGSLSRARAAKSKAHPGRRRRGAKKVAFSSRGFAARFRAATPRELMLRIEPACRLGLTRRHDRVEIPTAKNGLVESFACANKVRGKFAA